VKEWSTACPDWASRLIAGQSIIPPPIYPDQAEQALAIFKQLRVVDLPKTVWDATLGAEGEYRSPNFGECSEQWVFDWVAAIFGAYDAETGNQLIREFYLLISKKNTKSTIAAGIMLTAVILCWREEEEHLILAPTKEVANNSFKPAAGMVRADDELRELFHIQDHVRTITHRITRASLRVVAADTDTVSGKKSGRIMVDEHWVFGTRPDADGMFMEATGGQVSRDEGWVIYLTTQSETPPAGVFAEKLKYYRNVRDGVIVDRKSLGVLYEFPPDMVLSGAYLDPANFYITNPNIGRSVNAEWIADELVKHRAKTDGSLQKFLAKHLNVEIGLNLRTDRWAGADFWAACAEKTLTLATLLGRCEVVVIGIDGGGLDDLLGLAVIGRQRDSRKWLVWTHAWAHSIVLQRRMEIAPALKDFESDGDLTIVDVPGDDVTQLCDIVCEVRDAGLLPEKNAIGVDGAGIGDIVDELCTPARGFDQDDDTKDRQIVAVSQGWRLNGAIKTTERKLPGKELAHGGSRLMNWCVGNARIVPQGNAVSITKQASGSAKIDPLMAVFDAVFLMLHNPAAVNHAPTIRWL
jgi:phage terminase large subunit-like protein